MAEIHDNGSVTLTAAVGGFASPNDTQPNHIDAKLAEGFVADFVALVGSTARELSIPGGYETLINMRWSGAAPIYIRIPDPLGYLLGTEYSTGINEFVPVSAAIPANASDSMLLTATQELGLDITNHGGAQGLYSIKSKLDSDE
ncbi:hypothetical protein ABC337_13865 [Arthrobacter sp. 1P04PC]|uniref:hypothetical protein n=1 Tax=unclassified Arthrobacter TaxID=235627 RepID=UPI0039A05F8D